MREERLQGLAYNSALFLVRYSYCYIFVPQQNQRTCSWRQVGQGTRAVNLELSQTFGDSWNEIVTGGVANEELTAQTFWGSSKAQAHTL